MTPVQAVLHVSRKTQLFGDTVVRYSLLNMKCFSRNSVSVVLIMTFLLQPSPGFGKDMAPMNAVLENEETGPAPPPDSGSKNRSVLNCVRGVCKQSSESAEGIDLPAIDQSLVQSYLDRFSEEFRKLEREGKLPPSVLSYNEETSRLTVILQNYDVIDVNIKGSLEYNLGSGSIAGPPTDQTDIWGCILAALGLGPFGVAGCIVSVFVTSCLLAEKYL